ncbi:glycosyltransferase N-terminal domain-containing protein [Arenibacter sp. GZD96]|uniref:3-deoxy-D-manno-octulosonic acid transferase n=1 Tax=Aurantibrevibacter litoralis TaxID=3106030 RepID=UPI002AFEBFDC|nr:glycosyltransferase N-terminal domain-containing protein [Arenibacter sp. GZD-96]MEA1784528.1 glycosyltransferase N-terminal domain-containing protein [Arenibacter sp. GZD-96]
MYLIYDFIIHIASLIVGFTGLFHPKLKLFASGRKRVFPYLEKHITKGDKVVWMHCASLGEFEQGLPVIEKIKAQYPHYKTLITFFSPSGYEVKKNSDAADFITYLPLDTRRNAVRFLEITQPVLAIFVKYEIWPNFLRTLQRKTIPTLLISAIFRPNQLFFKWHGSLMRRALGAFTHLFVQDEQSKELLQSIKITRVTVNGDTRLDRVSEILERDNTLSFMSQFKQDALCVVAGSTWPEDEAVIANYINTSNAPTKYVIAPHKIIPEKINGLKNSLQKKTILYSELSKKTIEDYDVLILDTIGLLTKVYSYADTAYVGGGFATGLHNTLEPAVFGIPVIIGPRYSGFKEVADLVALQGVFSINNATDFSELMDRFLAHTSFRKTAGQANATYILQNKGASSKISSFTNTLLLP